MIYFYTVGDERTASSRMRVWHVARALGIPHQVTVIRPYRSGWELRPRRLFDVGILVMRMLIYPRARFYVHKVISPPELVMIFRLFGARVIFDIDDEVGGRWARYMISAASQVVVSSHALEDDIKKYHHRTTLIPTSVPLDYYKPKEDTELSKRPVIGWIGTGKGQVENLRILVPVFRRLAKAGLPFTFCLIGAQGLPEIHNLFDEWGTVIDDIEWADEQVVARAIQRFDIGVMPLVDTSRSRKKAGFKLLQYMASGLPVVASTVGENLFIIKDRVNGRLAQDEDAWFECLSSLLADERARRKLGESGLATIRAEYQLDVLVPLYKMMLA